MHRTTPPIILRVLSALFPSPLHHVQVEVAWQCLVNGVDVLPGWLANGAAVIPDRGPRLVVRRSTSGPVEVVLQVSLSPSSTPLKFSTTIPFAQRSPINVTINPTAGVCVWVRACVRACVCGACARACVHLCVCVCILGSVRLWLSLVLSVVQPPLCSTTAQLCV